MYIVLLTPLSQGYFFAIIKSIFIYNKKQMRNVSDGVDLDNIYDYLSLEPKSNERIII